MSLTFWKFLGLVIPIQEIQKGAIGMEIQTGTGKLAGIAAQVSCTSFAALMLGSSSAMAITSPEDTMDYGRIDLSTGESGKSGYFKFDLDGDGTDDFEIDAYGGGKFAKIAGLDGKFRKNTIADSLFSIGDTVDESNKDLDFKGEVEIYEGSYSLGLELGQTAYLGLKLLRFDPAAEEEMEFFGWVEVTRGSITAGRSGVQTASGVGAPINPVPLPASLPLLAAGVGGLAALRRKRKAA